MLGIENFDLLHNIHAGKHLYQFYKSKDDYLKVMTAYFKAGLEKGDACLWLLADKFGGQEFNEFCRKAINRFSFYRLTGQLEILSANEWYLKNGRFDEDQALQNAGQWVERAAKGGFTRLRGAGMQVASQGKIGRNYAAMRKRLRRLSGNRRSLLYVPILFWSARFLKHGQ